MFGGTFRSKNNVWWNWPVLHVSGCILQTRVEELDVFERPKLLGKKYHLKIQIFYFI
jgi:hypothetical protein